MKKKYLTFLFFLDLKEGGFAMQLLKNRLARGPVDEFLCINVLEAIMKSTKYSERVTALDKSFSVFAVFCIFCLFCIIV